MKFFRARKLLILALSALAVAASCRAEAALFGMDGKKNAAQAAVMAEEARKSRLPRVEVAVVSRLTRAEQGISTTSTLKPYEEVVVIPKVTGRIARRSVAKGDAVKSGDLLMVLDSRNQKAEYASLQAQVAVKKAELEQSKVTLADAKRELDRYGRLRKSGYATQQEYDTRSTAYRSALAAKAKAAAQVQQAQAVLDAQAVLLGEYELTSPIGGVVLDDYDLAQGALLTPSSKALRIGSVDKLKADVDIAERDMGRLRLGMDAVLTFEALPGQTFYGTVTLIDPYVNTSTRTVGAEITVDNQATGGKLRAGMFARVLLVEASEENPLAIPSEALRRDGTVVVIREGRAVIQPVKIGVASGGLVTVSQGLKVGEAVVTSGGMTLKDGDEVNVVVPDEPAKGTSGASK
ncbi:MAG: efflux RND transporter periplasmic adaptor subunit [Pyramidobacter sp.]|jgi:RND family efflux transporter MFP subunit